MTEASRLVITTGEPAGIGPDVCIQLAQESIGARLVFLADEHVIQQRANQLGLPIDILRLKPDDAIPQHQAGEFPVIHVDCAEPVSAGELNPDNASYVIRTLQLATDMLLGGQADALVTAPVHKGIINDADIPFSGHTEWLAERTGAELPVMMLATPEMKVALVTTHLPLHEVSAAITSTRLEAVIRVLHHDLMDKFHMKAPRIRVCGLNPHAGEGGHLGKEESEIIQPVLHNLRAEGYSLEGPVPADTAFLPHGLSETDVILAMYHDQGLPVLKYSGFEQAVNITLGLPIIRVSVDHGTALELAGSGKSDASSLKSAISMAVGMANGDTTD